MERLLVLRLECIGVMAEASLNGVPLARTSGTQRTVTLAIHEYTLAGANLLELTIDPDTPPGPQVSDGHIGASLRLLLPRIGQLAHPENARTLAQIDWAPAAGVATEMPYRSAQTVELPIAFPRWRWFDVPPVTDVAELLPQVLAFVQGLALGLARGDPEPLVQAARLRFEELAQAYQHKLADDVGRFRAHVQALHAQQALKPVIPKAGALVLRPLAGGRLIECLTPDGLPLLRSPVAGGGMVSWPLRLAALEGRLYVLR